MKLVILTILIIFVLSISPTLGDDFEKSTFFRDRPTNLQSHLFNLAKSYERSYISLSQRGRLAVEPIHDRVTVEILSDSNLDLNSILGVPGVIFDGSFMDLIQVSVPLESLIELSTIPGVRFIRLPIKHYPLAISEGVSITGTDKWHSAGYKGKGVKIGIIDLGFKGYEKLLGKDLPENVVVKSFYGSVTGNGDITGGGQDHGTACAEIIHDVASEADLYLVNFNSLIEELYAIEWLAKEGVNIISSSIGSFYGPFDGTSYECTIVDIAYNKGILWVNSIGNSGDSHYSGIFKDENNNRWHEFDLDDETINIEANKGDIINAYLSWWEADNYLNVDYDLYLFDNENSNTPVAFSDDIVVPAEYLEYRVLEKGTYYLKARRVRGFGEHKLKIHVVNHKIEHFVSSNSLCVPADAENCFSVSAFNWADGVLEPYNSQGPTSDGRIKPDICAPTRVSTSTYGLLKFAGTSAAAPHVAGAAALIKSWQPELSVDEIRQYLENRAIDMEEPGKDNLTGWGRLNLPETLIFNRIPKISKLNIIPELPYTYDDLNCDYIYMDADDDPEIDTEIRWYKDGILQEKYNNSEMIPYIETSKNQTWYCTVKPGDGQEFGQVKTSPEVRINNTPPKTIFLFTIPINNRLICLYRYSDADNDPESGTEIRWYKDGELQADYNDKKIIPFEALAQGQKWYSSVKLKDGEEFGSIKKSNELEISNTETENFFSLNIDRTDVFQNYPNPFNPETWIPYQLREDATNVIFRIYTLSGQHIRTLDLGYKPAGFYIDKKEAAYWDGKNEDGEYVSSGIYFYTVKIGNFISTRKMIITQ